jgi:hypothetical protein
MIDIIRSDLAASCNPNVVNELLQTYLDAKRHFYAADHRPSAIEGGRFCEAAFRILQEAIDGEDNFTPIGDRIPSVDALVRHLENKRFNSPTLHEKWQQDSAGLHIPRALRIIFDIRNHRDAAHLGAGIDPNKQDAMLVVATMDWVVAEFVRLYHKVSADKAQQIVQGLVTPTVPAIQDFNGVPKVLNTRLNGDQCLLLLLYMSGSPGAQWHQLLKWMPKNYVQNLQSQLNSLVETARLVNFDEVTGFYELTATGIRNVQECKLADSI